MIKQRTILVFVFLLAAISAFPGTESHASVNGGPGKKVGATQGTYISPPATAVAQHRSTTGSSNQAGQQDNGKTFLKVSPDAAMHGSVAPVCDAFLSLIGIIHQDTSEAYPPPINRPRQQVLFRVLFRVIISPNAP